MLLYYKFIFCQAYIHLPVSGKNRMFDSLILEWAINQAYAVRLAPGQPGQPKLGQPQPKGFATYRQ